MSLINIKIEGIPYQVEEGLTILEAANWSRNRKPSITISPIIAAIMGLLCIEENSIPIAMHTVPHRKKLAYPQISDGQITVPWKDM